MPYCPYCDQSVDVRAIACPHCRSLLKAHGHPGIPLHRARGEASLCQSCLYDLDDTCTFPQRPDARECTLYRNQLVVPSQTQANTTKQQLGRLLQFAWLVLIGLGIIALLLAL